MPREVDPKRTRKALRTVRKLGAPVEGVDYSGWEREFLQEVEARLERYGSAFADLSKGQAEEALSRLQTQKLKEIAKKAAGKEQKPRAGLKPGKGFKRRTPPKGAPSEEDG